MDSRLLDSSEVTVETSPLPTSLSLEEQALMRALTSVIPRESQSMETATELPAENPTVPHFELDESTLRSLQQFIVNHGLNAEQTTEQVLDI